MPRKAPAPVLAPAPVFAPAPVLAAAPAPVFAPAPDFNADLGDFGPDWTPVQIFEHKRMRAIDKKLQTIKCRKVFADTLAMFLKNSFSVNTGG